MISFAMVLTGCKIEKKTTDYTRSALIEKLLLQNTNEKNKRVQCMLKTDKNYGVVVCF